ncbi:MAG: hypothetical protein HWE20_03805 [Gammaproteobacteria bacterium]|nr:hypothetical protein [Gammaproteobacteria bacterium]
MATHPFTTRIDTKVLNDLKFLGSAMNKTPSSIAAECIREEVSIRAERLRRMQASELEAADGQFVSAEAVNEWLLSLGSTNELPVPKADIRR